jgi:predicted NBD/HSP70 family sugar kinase
VGASTPGGVFQRPSLVPVLEIGGSHVTAALADLVRGEVWAGSAHSAQLEPGGSAGEILDAVVACGRTLAAGRGEGWGVALPGPFDYERGIALYEGVGKFEALYAVDVRRALEDGLPGPPSSITFLNDAEAFLWGELLYGAATGYARCVGITLGTGVGSAFFADGAVHRSGPGVPPEGRADLLRIDGMPLEDVVSTRALLREYHLRTGEGVEGAAELATRARLGDEVAAAVLRDAFVRLGAELRPWVEAFGAQALVVGGAMTGSWDLLSPALAEGLGAAGSGALGNLVVAVAAHSAEAPLLGAAAAARRHRAPERGVPDDLHGAAP